jgi:hypothetical protein
VDVANVAQQGVDVPTWTARHHRVEAAGFGRLRKRCALGAHPRDLLHDVHGDESRIIARREGGA